jgi:hypothetical protein
MPASLQLLALSNFGSMSIAALEIRNPKSAIDLAA